MIKSPYNKHSSTGVCECKRCVSVTEMLAECFRSFREMTLSSDMESKKEQSEHLASFSLGLQIGMNLIRPDKEEAHRTFVHRALVLSRQ